MANNDKYPSGSMVFAPSFSLQKNKTDICSPCCLAAALGVTAFRLRVTVLWHRALGKLGFDPRPQTSKQRLSFLMAMLSLANKLEI